MKNMKEILLKSMAMLLVMTFICGIVYTGIVSIFAGVFFKDKANASIIEVNGKKYGCELLAQNFCDEKHMWGRVMNIDVSTYKDKQGKVLMYASPSNLSPKSDKLKSIVNHRISMIKNSNVKMHKKIPVDLLTCSGSGLDPDISLDAAYYQVDRIAKNNGITKEKVESIISKCTNHKVLGFLGEETVNVLKVNLMLEGIIS